MKHPPIKITLRKGREITLNIRYIFIGLIRSQQRRLAATHINGDIQRKAKKKPKPKPRTKTNRKEATKEKEYRDDTHLILKRTD